MKTITCDNCLFGEYKPVFLDLFPDGMELTPDNLELTIDVISWHEVIYFQDWREYYEFTHRLERINIHDKREFSSCLLSSLVRMIGE